METPSIRTWVLPGYPLNINNNNYSVRDHCHYQATQIFTNLIRGQARCSYYRKRGSAFYYRKRGSAPYILREVLSVCVRERERDTETDGSDVTIVAVKLAMSLHFPLPKVRTKWRRVYTFPCQKFALFVSPFTLPVSHFWNGHQCGAEIRNEFTLPLPKDFFLFVPNLSNGASHATNNRKLKTKLMIKSCPVLHCSYHRKTESN